MTVKGYSNAAKLDGQPCQFATVSPLRTQQHGLDVVAHGTFQSIGTDSVEALSTALIIVATSHAALTGDMISITSGALQYYEAKVWKVTTNAIYLAEQLPSAPLAAVTFSILRHKAQVINSDGSVTVAQASTATGSNQLKGKIAGTALTGSYATLITLTFDASMLYFFNSCDDTIILSIDSGTTDAFELEAGESFTLDLGSNNRKISSGVTIRAKQNSATPTNGTIRCAAVG